MSKNFSSNVLEYTPAQYYPGACSYVSYTFTHPTKNSTIRKRIKVNFVRGVAARKKYATDLCRELNYKLSHGWNPIVAGEVSKGFTLLSNALDSFIKIKSTELRENSMRSYRSYVHKIENWLEKEGRQKEYVINFEKKDARNFLNDIILVNQSSSRTYNNYLTALRTIWNWMIENQYANFNPFAGLKKKIAGEKTRVLITDKVRNQIREELEVTDPQFLMCCKLLYYCFIRPNEMTHLKSEHFNFAKQTIFIPPGAAKNRKGEYVTIPDSAISDIAHYITNSKCDSTQYLISRTWDPGDVRLDPREMTRKWSHLREELNFPKEMQFYSLKDSGIVRLLELGVSPHQVMKQARHSSLEETTHYLRHVGSINEEVKEKASKF